MIKRFFYAIILWTVFSLEAHAGYDYQYEKRMDRYGPYESEITGKLERGLTNIIFGWTEIMKTPADMSQSPKAGLFKSAVLGIPYGVARFAGRTLVGVYETVTCPAPQGPIMKPIQGESL